MPLSALWKPKENYIPLDPESITRGNFGDRGFYEKFLPYERLYKNLNEKQLRELLADAKKFHWQILNLQRCGLDTLPEDVWDLPDLKILYLGSVEHSTGLGDENTFRVGKTVGNDAQAVFQ